MAATFRGPCVRRVYVCGDAITGGAGRIIQGCEDCPENCDPEYCDLYCGLPGRDCGLPGRGPTGIEASDGSFSYGSGANLSGGGRSASLVGGYLGVIAGFSAGASGVWVAR